MSEAAAARAARDARVLELRRAGVSVSAIRAEVGLRTDKQVEEALGRALRKTGSTLEPEQVRALELDRLDRLQQAVWLKAIKGNDQALATVLRLTEMRQRLAGVASDVEAPLLAAFDETVAALPTEACDATVIAVGRRLAARIDAAARSIDGQAETKALYLTPHLMNVLAQLGATPLARREAAEKAEAALSGRGAVAEDDFEAFKRQKASAA